MLGYPAELGFARRGFCIKRDAACTGLDLVALGCLWKCTEYVLGFTSLGLSGTFPVNCTLYVHILPDNQGIEPRSELCSALLQIRTRGRHLMGIEILGF